MRAMTKLLSTLSFALFVTAGCGGKPALVDKLEQFTEQVCACKDEACADALNKQVSEYTLSALKDIKEDEIDKLAEQLDPLEKKFNACYEKAAGHPPRD